MKIATTVSSARVTEAAADELLAFLASESNEAPQLLLVYFTEQHAGAALLSCLRAHLPQTRIMGCSSCQGVMTQKGYHAHEQGCVAIWALWDPKGAYGCAAVGYQQDDASDIVAASRRAVDLALARAGRPGELPALIWLHATPGMEEQVIAGIQQRLGASVPIVGGSAADNGVKGRWQLLADDGCFDSGVAVTLFYPACRLICSFQSAYMKAGFSGIVTRAQGRELLEIDAELAADVYDRWTQGALSAAAQGGGSVMRYTTFFPLARQAGALAGVPYFKLSHPEAVTSRRGIRLFTEVAVGERVILMRGDGNTLVTQAGRASSFTPVLGYGDELGEPIGALNVFCAGSMMALGADMSQVVDSLRASVGSIPFIAPFTFGEQGRFSGGENAHGNLMVSTVLLCRSREVAHAD